MISKTLKKGKKIRGSGPPTWECSRETSRNSSAMKTKKLRIRKLQWKWVPGLGSGSNDAETEELTGRVRAMGIRGKKTNKYNIKSHTRRRAKEDNRRLHQIGVGKNRQTPWEGQGTPVKKHWDDSRLQILKNGGRTKKDIHSTRGVSEGGNPQKFAESRHTARAQKLTISSESLKYNKNKK